MAVTEEMTEFKTTKIKDYFIVIEFERPIGGTIYKSTYTTTDDILSKVGGLWTILAGLILFYTKPILLKSFSRSVTKEIAEEHREDDYYEV